MTDTLDLTAALDLHLEAYTETDATRRRELVERAWHPDGVLIDPPIDGAGHDGIAALADIVLAHYPGHRFVRTTGIEAHHNSARYGWALLSPAGEVALTGTDVVDIADDGRIARIVGFFGELQTAEVAR